MKRVFWGILAVCFWGNIGYCQNLQPPVGGRITSDYGPRNVSGYNWHWGIDYSATFWTSVRTVEGGNISQIGYDAPPVDGWSSGWYIRISTTAKTWAYLHLSTGVSNNNPISPSGVFEIKNVTLENPANPTNTSNRYAFVFWTNKSARKADKVFVQCQEDEEISSWHVRYGNGYIVDSVTGSSVLSSLN